VGVLDKFSALANCGPLNEGILLLGKDDGAVQVEVPRCARNDGAED